MRGTISNVLHGVGHLDGDVGQRLGVGVDVHRGVGEELHVVLEQHHVHAAARRTSGRVPRICSAGRIVSG